MTSPSPRVIHATGGASTRRRVSLVLAFLALAGCSSAGAISRGDAGKSAGHAESGSMTAPADGDVARAPTIDAAPPDACDPARRGTCSSGRCLEILASEQFSPVGVAVAPTGVYWTNSARGIARTGSVVTVPLCGGAPRTIASGRNGPSGIALDGLGVFWGETGSGSPDAAAPGGVVSAPLGAASDSDGPMVIASAEWASGFVALDAANVYWANDTALVKVPRGGGVVTTLATQTGVGHIAVDSTTLYWAALEAGVMSVPLHGGTPTTLASADYALDVAVDATSVYWVDALGPSTVKKCAIGNCGATVVTLASGQVYAVAVAVDATSVYWVNSCSAVTDTCSGGSVVKVALGGGTPVTLVEAHGAPVAIAVDETSVYWTEAASFGTVMKLTPK